MATTTTYGLGTGLQGATSAPVVLDASSASADGNINLPDGFSPYSADFVRSGTDLTLTSSDGQTVVIRDYFASDDAPTLVATDGGSISGDLASRLAGPLAPAQTAQATPDLNSEPIGSVQTLTGTVSITRTDGTREDVSVGTPVFQGDILESGDDGAIGVVLADETTFSMSENGRMVLDEMVYDPGTQTGSLAISVVEGVFTFVSGEIAKTSPEAMTVATPVATIGIRGTQVGISFKEGSGLDLVLMEESDGFVGEVVVQNDGGVQILNLANQGTAVANQNAAPDAPATVDRNDIAQTFGGSLGVLPASAGANSYGVEPPAEIQGETAAEEQLEAAAEEEVEEEEVAIEEELADFETAAGGEPPAPPAAPPPPAPEPEPEPEPEPIVFVEPEPEPEPEDEPEDDDDDEEDNAPPPNVDPLAANDTDVIDEDTSLTFTAADLLANDTDPDGGTLSIVSISAPQHGTLVNHGNGTWTYTPDANFHGPDSVTYVVSDGQGGTATATASVSVTSINDAPELIGGVDEDMLEDGGTLSGTLEASDVEGDDLSFSLDGDAANGAVTLDADGTWTYTPDTDFHGDDAFTYQVTDGNGGVTTATATIAVESVNDAPVASDDSASLDEDSSITLTAADLLANDNDPDGPDNELSIVNFSDPVHGLLVDNGNDTWTYTPDENFNGMESLTYTLSDGTTSSILAANDSISTAQTIARDQFGVSNNHDVGDDSFPHVEIRGQHNDDNDADFYAFELQAGETIVLDIDYGLNQGDSVDTMLWLYNDAGTQVRYNDDDWSNPGGDGSVHAYDSYLTYTAQEAGTYYAAVTAYYDDPMESGSSYYDGGDYVLNTSIVPTETSTGFGDEPTIIYDVDTGGHHQSADSLTDTATLNITVNSVNDAPVAGDDSDSFDEDTSMTFFATELLENDSDVDGDDLTIISFSDPEHGTLVDHGDGSLTYTPDQDFNGIDTLTYVVSDGQGGTDTATATAFISAVNDTPELIGGVDEDMLEDGDTISGALAASDVDGDNLSFSLAEGGNAANGTVTVEADGTWTYMPNANFNGDDAFTYQVSDGNGSVTTATATVAVASVNDAPELIGSVDEDMLEDGGTISGALAASDVDGDNLSFSLAEGGDAANGTVTVEADGTWTYTPNANFNGDDAFTYQVSDDNGGVTTATATVTVASVNDAPELTGGVDEDMLEDDGTLSGTLEASDVEGDSLTFSLAAGGAAANGTATVNADGTWTYTPDTDFHGDDTFTYQVTDENGGVSTATATIAVTSVNDAPVAADVSDSFDEDTSVTFWPSELLENDSDVDGDALSIINFSDPAHGTLAENGDGTWTYTPDADFNGVDSFTYTVSDGQGGTDTATATAYINAINDAPELIGGVDEDMLEDSGTLSGVLAASDVDGDDISFSLANGGEAQNGTATVDANGTWTYTPDADFSGDDTFTYQVTDENGGTTTATATIAVANVAEPIVLNDDYLSLDEDTSVTFSAADLLGNDSGDDLNISSIGVPENGNLVHNGDETWTYTPHENFEGIDSLTYSVSSGDGNDSDGVAFVTNDSISTAQTIARGQFGVSESSDVGDDTDPHVTIQANHTGYGDVDFYAFTLQEGEVLTLDIDRGYSAENGWGDADDVDTMLWVYDANGNQVGYNDDYNTSAGGEGSDHGVDAYHEFSPTTAGTYYVAVTGYYQNPMGDYSGTYSGEGSVSGYETGTYTLNASITPTEDSTGFGNEAQAVAETEEHSATTATLTFDVNGVNDAPELHGGVDEDMLEDGATISGTLDASDIDNFDEDDSGDGDSGTLTFSLAANGGAQNGNVTVDADGQWFYTPNENFVGDDTFTYQVTDEEGLTDTATATVTVAPVDDGLDAMDDAFSVNSGSPITFTAAELLANDDRDSDHTLTIISMDAPANGTLVDNGNDSWTYTPDVGFSGADTFSYTVSTGDGEERSVGIISNDTIATAQSIARNDFGIAPSVDVGNDDVPRVEIRGEHTGRGDIDFFAFDMKAGEVLTLDIDYGRNQGVSMDTMLWVYNEAGTRVGYNDDTSSYVGGYGSTHSYDSFVNLTIQTDGTYYAAVTGFYDDPMSPGESGYATGDYVLNTSITPTTGSTGFGTVPQVIYDSDGSNFIVTDELSEADVTINVDSGTDANVIMGGAGNDTMYGTGNSDTFIGGDGFDTAIMGGAFDDYTVTTDADGNLVLSVDDEGEAISDTLIGVEQVNFEDRNNDGDNSSSYSVSTDENGGVTLEPDLIA